MTAFIAKNRTALIIAVVVIVLGALYWLADPNKATSVLRFAWTFSIPLVLGASCGLIGERSGIINIGIEGQMLASAFTGFFVASNSGNLWLGVVAGLAVGALMGAFLGWVAVAFQVNQIIIGVVMNIVATGITSFYYVQGHVLPSSMPVFAVPGLSDIPLLGVFFQGGPIAFLTLFVVFATAFALFRTRWGLRTRSIGEYPTAADTAGINVNRMRIINTTIAGLLAGAAGVFMSMEQTSTFERGMTAGKGFLALAIMIFGAWYPVRALFAALFFGLATALASQLQADQVVAIPQQFVNLLPYVLTLVVLAVAAGKVRPPAAEGIPFVKGEGS